MAMVDLAARTQAAVACHFIRTSKRRNVAFNTRAHATPDLSQHRCKLKRSP